MNAIEVSGINLTIGSAKILKDVSFSVPKGCIYGLIGQNGAGKTSMLRILLGLTSYYKGSVRLFGSDDLGRQRMKIGAVMDSLGADNFLSAEKYLHRVCSMLGAGDRAKERELLEKVGLSDTGSKRIGNFSLGMKRRLMIACALAGDPELLVLDEPFNGIDPNGMADIRIVLQQLCCDGITVLVTSHMITELIKLSTQFGVMKHGEFTGSYSSDEIYRSNATKAVFRIGSPKEFSDCIKANFPQLSCTFNSAGEASVFGNVDIEVQDKINRLCSSAQYIGDMVMNEEEFLLWKMNE